MKKILLLTLSVAILTACSEDEEGLNGISIPASIEINYDEEKELTVTSIPANLPVPQIDWVSEDDRIVSVSNTGTVSGLLVGKTNITATTEDNRFSAVCEVTVNPTNFLYKEPLLDFSASKTRVKQYETRTLAAEIDEAILYEGDGNLRGVMYVFENGSFSGVIVLLEENTYVAERVVDFLKQRYQFLAYQDDVGYFRWNGVAAAVSYHETFGFNVMYIPSEENDNGRLSFNALRDKSQALGLLLQKTQTR